MSNKVCTLCGYPIMKHVAPPYGTSSEEAGPTGLWCPTDRRIRKSRVCESCGGLGGISVTGNKGDRYMSSCDECCGTGGVIAYNDEPQS